MFINSKKEFHEGLSDKEHYSVNWNYEEWCLPTYKLNQIFTEVHVKCEGDPNYDNRTVVSEGYIYKIDLKENGYPPLKKYEWMDKDREALIFKNPIKYAEKIKVTVKFIIEGSE
jgi:hypothetical protein